MTVDKPVVIPTIPTAVRNKKSGRNPKYPFKEMEIGTMFKVHMDVKYGSIEKYCYKKSRELGRTFRLATFDADPYLYVVRLA